MATARVDYVNFHGELQTPLRSFATYAVALVNWPRRAVRLTFKDVLEGMNVAAENIDQEDDRAESEEEVCLSVVLII